MAAACANRFDAPRTKLSKVYLVGKLVDVTGRSGIGAGGSSAMRASAGADGSTVRVQIASARGSLVCVVPFSTFLPQVCNSVGKCIGAARRRPREEVPTHHTPATVASQIGRSTARRRDLRRRDVATFLLFFLG